MVILSMTPKTPGVTVTLVASLCITLEWLLVSVRQQMSVEMILALECLVTHGAEILPLITVRQSVLRKS